jgi:hypothetical protein
LRVWILPGITAVIILIVVVICQSDIRRLLERFPASLLNRETMKREEPAGLVHLLTTAAGRFG